ncbi:MAG: hypothetical protein NVSMB21_13030 [Vulcanimicrobiaceae bacterium]
MTLSLDVRKRLGPFELALACAIPDGVTVVVGPSGAGKTTLLRLVAGLLRPDAGRISLGGRTLDDARAFVPPFRREIGFVFQEYALFPHLSACENVAFGLRARGVPRAARRSRAHELLERFGLGRFAAARVGELSGGQRQRVALARALAIRPRALLLDEPLSALDAATRSRVRDELFAHVRELAIPTLLVSHDPSDLEAHPGRVLAIGRPVA